MGRPGDIGRNMGNDKNTEMGRQARKIETKNSRQRKTWGETETTGDQDGRAWSWGRGGGTGRKNRKISRKPDPCQGLTPTLPPPTTGLEGCCWVDRASLNGVVTRIGD